MTTHEILKLVRENITDPNKWCQRNAHIGGAGCLGWHIIKCSGGEKWMDLAELEAGTFLATFINPGHNYGVLHLAGPVISQFNDTHTHAEVLALLDEAIEATTPVIRDLPDVIKYIFRPESIAA